MGDSDENSVADKPVQVIYAAESVESSQDPPMEEWSSLDILVPEENQKKLLYNEGLYDPGSGEICAQYITMSASSVLRHPYYKYPPIIDPGIEVALLAAEPKVVYPDDGQALYLALCKEMNQCPVRIFYKGLLRERIDLRYYCIDPNGFRAMAKALKYNNTVEELDLTDNFLNHDACYHMGEMLLSNRVLTELNLRGCRIGPQGARRLFHNLHQNDALKVLDLSYNKLGDDGMEYLAKAVRFGLNVTKLNLSYNSITGKGVSFFIEPFETHNKFTHLNFSWNKIYTPGGFAFLEKLSESSNLEVLNLSWNALSGARFGLALKHILFCPLLRKLNVSNNMLTTESIRNMLVAIGKAANLTFLNLSFNPITSMDALSLLKKVGEITTNVRTLLMDNVNIREEFLLTLADIKKLKSKKHLVVTYGNLEDSYKIIGPDPRDIILRRLDYVVRKTKKSKVDLALFALQRQKDNVLLMNTKELMYGFRREGVYLDEDLVEELAINFQEPGQSKTAKVKNLDVNAWVEYIKRKWPDKQLPPTPPPELEPVPVKKKGKGKKGKK
ncbi:hypothetical protein PYW08_004117 [Mythimna loreyi]|uniref:Uncharacterized protein n=1 Tax=Mythimna loreyi TaxID=667449 RepID=A0ACC2QZP9_9NEOP|nr:hypothetical protein PYW08_004117 [Mythimna loreyi]